MNIQWIGSPNFELYRRGYKPLAIVNHIMCGTLEGTDSWFKNPASQVSAHFGVGKNGEIHQYVNELSTAWANGRKSTPDESWLANFPAGVNPNLWTISIEHEGYPEDGLTEAQTKATIELHKYLVEKWNIPIDPIHITGHFRIDSVSRKDCPGPKFPWDRLFKELKGGYQMKPEDANKIIEFLQAAYGIDPNPEFGRLADELRLASGQEPQNK
jgi:N-acetyl-anhydromuramyl-L-alanine amidase AmpD